jgi:hypothetical protein
MHCIISCIICVCDTECRCTALVAKMMLSLYSETHNLIHSMKSLNVYVYIICMESNLKLCTSNLVRNEFCNKSYKNAC